MTTDALPTEPADGTIVAWFDSTGGLFATLQRDDGAAKEGDAGDAHWWLPVYDEPADQRTWGEVCAEFDQFRGPVVLAPADGEVSA